MKAQEYTSPLNLR